MLTLVMTKKKYFHVVPQKALDAPKFLQMKYGAEQDHTANKKNMGCSYHFVGRPSHNSYYIYEKPT
jgi:ATP sulfurylase